MNNGHPPDGREQRGEGAGSSTKLIQDVARIVPASQYCEGLGGMSSLDKYMLVSPESSGKWSGERRGGKGWIWSGRLRRDAVRFAVPARWGHTVLVLTCSTENSFGQKYSMSIPAFGTSALALSSPRLTPPSPAQPSLPHPIGNPQGFVVSRGSIAVALCETDSDTSILLTIHPILWQ
ncbi:hypothetical protein LA080_009599 [Diaporthe eres]|nr:hypothetical protein LA080_009599 [Diaporthe eres]